ncbi:hypothetical protein PSU4_55810 [Pseudonocardia sulfidoxydans NBRC 16205]|uniref:DUF3311 domain-containing protein n=1 Tax=Pseudonocardia sulfidoxydans NBRC 16205 TaxID=1223511 RepID=A0A511DQK6_9PSEU|nr:DUF3311 domain-containing protein [Pseudonocardia sulfidoxydans]GEL26627.1 hypothetical protein PSU4_55810 [Pseudonocardia sulfidoxydans NBRC 16205]
MSETTPRGPRGGGERTGLRFSAWNLLLIVPLLMLVTPWFNKTDPTLLGMPFFYWIQFVWVFVGVVCVAIVFHMTRDEPVTRGADELGVDDLDERDAR